jgi:hypothetical protein
VTANQILRWIGIGILSWFGFVLLGVTAAFLDSKELVVIAILGLVLMKLAIGGTIIYLIVKILVKLANWADSKPEKF